MLGGCFLIGAAGATWTGDDRAYIGSVSDNPYDVRTFVRACRGEGHAHVGTELAATADPPLDQRGHPSASGETTRGVNEAGLAFTAAAVFVDEEAEAAQAVSYGATTAALMSRCATAREAVDFLSSQPERGFACNLLLADADAEVIYVEVSRHNTAVRDAVSRERGGVLVAVNCFRALGARTAPQAGWEDVNNNRRRAERGEELAARLRGRLDVQGFMELLSDHAHADADPAANPVIAGWGYSICNHGTLRGESYSAARAPWGTVSAEVLDPSRRVLWYAFGWPCGASPEYGDQYLQGESWGTFVGFRLDGSGAYTSPDGAITSAGSAARVEVPIVR